MHVQNRESQVIIIGGGPCGLLSALLLARFGIQTVLLEKHPDISFHPKAMGTTRRTGEIYRSLGLYEQMLEGDSIGDSELLSIWSKGFTGELLGAAPLKQDATDFTPCKRFHCPQPHSEAVLRDAIENESLAQLHFNTRATNFEQTNDGVAVHYECLDSHETGTIHGQWLIAADGDRSPVREKLGITRTGPGEMGHFISVYFRADYGKHLADRKAMLYQLFGDDFFEFFVAVNGSDLWLMHHFLQEGESHDQYTHEQLRDMIAYTSGLPDVPVTVLSASPWVMSPHLTDQWRVNRIFFTGDASARLSPAGGLGMNTGMQSAHNLAWKIAAVVHGHASESLLDTYEHERLKTAQFTLENTQSNATELFEIIESAFRGDWDATKKKIAATRRAGSGLGQDLGMMYESEAILTDAVDKPAVNDPINDYIPTAKPGHRAPHVWIVQQEQRISTLDLFCQGFALLCGREGHAWHKQVKPINAELPQSLPLTCHVEEQDFTDMAGEFAQVYALSPTGAVLVRPDGYIAARWDTIQPNALNDAMQMILHGPRR